MSDFLMFCWNIVSVRIPWSHHLSRVSWHKNCQFKPVSDSRSVWQVTRRIRQMTVTNCLSAFQRFVAEVIFLVRWFLPPNMREVLRSLTYLRIVMGARTNLKNCCRKLTQWFIRGTTFYWRFFCWNFFFLSFLFFVSEKLKFYVVFRLLARVEKISDYHCVMLRRRNCKLGDWFFKRFITLDNDFDIWQKSLLVKWTFSASVYSHR